ncbi:cgi-94 protein [Ilyonectria robusta]
MVRGLHIWRSFASAPRQVSELVSPCVPCIGTHFSVAGDRPELRHTYRLTAKNFKILPTSSNRPVALRLYEHDRRHVVYAKCRPAAPSPRTSSAAGAPPPWSPRKAQGPPHAHPAILPAPATDSASQDYTLRAKDFNKKKAQLKALREKASERNEDEFYFGMLSRKGPGSRIMDGRRWTGTVEGDQLERAKALRRLRRQLELAQKKLKALSDVESALEVQRAKMAKTATSGGQTRKGKKIMVRTRKR